MTRKSLGYVELEWTCPNCQTKNPGAQKTCLACGSPQPVDVQFEQATKQDLITDEKKISEAKKGADIHCPYCGARNAADAADCAQCGGDLKGGEKRVAGRVVGAYKTEKEPVKEINCPSCSAKNLETSSTCTACGASLTAKPKPVAKVVAPAATAPVKSNKWVGIILAAVLGLLVLCVFVIVALTSKKENVAGVVNGVQWSRSVEILDLRDVTKEEWREDVPSDGVLGNCERKYHHTQSDPEGDYEEVCGTPYSEETGSGYAEVVQDCEYKIYQDYCQYTIQEWQVVDTTQLQGSDFNPQWPQANLSGNQRAGKQEETYKVIFETDKGMYTYVTTDEQLYRQCTPGSEWTLVINALNNVVSIEPK